MIAACLLNSHRWLHARLSEQAADSSEMLWVDDPTQADVVIYPAPPWPDPQAPDHVRHLDRRLLPRLFVYSQEDRPVVWAPGVYTSTAADHPQHARVRGGFYVSHANYEPEHVSVMKPRSIEHREYLWCFVGTVQTCPSVRAPLVQLKDPRALVRDTGLWSERYRWAFEGPEQEERSRYLAAYAESLHQASFVVCPRGKGPSSVRLFEAMRVGRCPVVISDSWRPPPFVPWEACSIRVASRDIARLPAILREREAEAAALGRRARAEWENYYSPQTMLNTLARSCLDVPPRDRNAARRAVMAAQSLASRRAVRALASTVIAGLRRP